MPLSEFRIQSSGIGDSGAVIVEGLKDSSGIYKSLLIKAFGKTMAVEGALLKQIPLKHQNGVYLSYEEGDKKLGGRTIYITFLFGFTSGVKEIFIIAVTEDGRQSVVKEP